mmetsp:Transcript_85719/g.276639  ORF Transcript_85719/g.276639 Transcript_85719/m.276639 type:complete len:214 (-) Transcript_85719:278-919(-)
MHRQVQRHTSILGSVLARPLGKADVVHSDLAAANVRGSQPPRAAGGRGGTGALAPNQSFEACSRGHGSRLFRNGEGGSHTWQRPSEHRLLEHADIEEQDLIWTGGARDDLPLGHGAALDGLEGADEGAAVERGVPREEHVSSLTKVHHVQICRSYDELIRVVPPCRGRNAAVLDAVKCRRFRAKHEDLAGADRGRTPKGRQARTLSELHVPNA